jgi:hypothetical protein
MRGKLGAASRGGGERVVINLPILRRVCDGKGSETPDVRPQG